MSLPRMKAVPEVGGNNPVKMDLNETEGKLSPKHQGGTRFIEGFLPFLITFLTWL